MTAPIWTTPAGFLFTATELLTTTTMVVAAGTPTYTLISGGLPAGLNLSTAGVISGIPSGILDLTRSEFVVRARNTSGVTDRTFAIDVTGSDAPIWITPSGYLPVGIRGESYALNKQWVDYQLSAVPDQAPVGTRLKYYISKGDGLLPPGLTLSQSGRITGYITDQLSYESDISTLGGYDDEAYDKFPYDHGGSYLGSVTDASMAGLPKLYQFRVTASDVVSQQDNRLFTIVVTDTTILTFNLTSMPAELALTSSTVYVSLPQWVNGSDLGTVRANNNVSLDVSTYDPYNILVLQSNANISNIPQNVIDIIIPPPPPPHPPPPPPPPPPGPPAPVTLIGVYEVGIYESGIYEQTVVSSDIVFEAGIYETNIYYDAG